MARIGLRGMVYAILNQDDKNGVAYGEVKSIPGAISATYTPATNSETLYADDGPYETATAIGASELEINAADLPFEAQSDLLGKTIGSDGTVLGKSSDNAPYAAFGFKSLKSNGKYRVKWFYKGKFRLPEESYQTKEDSPAFQSPTVTGTFVNREFDNAMEITGDEDRPGFVGVEQFFDGVYNQNKDTTAPTVSVAPDGASSVETSVDIVWTFDEAIRKEDVHDGNFYVMNASEIVSGKLTQSGDQTTVTFTPDSALASTTDYTAVASKNVRDLAGNNLAITEITNFTTA
ncbi:major tail protein [Tuberibacillus sp. Marseille-P3662]|uniref:major tail protein n=1 Tax=Tuberibacillus sp. Marseille-P3662 TaxID=1965358 RepID=UPI000A1CB38F|nr:major tail protein [Tuberibacillus sp. Marseille-P3662]